MSHCESPVSRLESVVGNAEQPPEPTSSKDTVQGKFWKVNYHLDDAESFESVFLRLKNSIVPICAEYIFAEEYGSSKNTRHIEGGFITREDRKRRTAIQSLFKFSDCQKSQKRNWNALIKYCSKENNTIIKSDNVKIDKPITKLTYDMLRPNQKELVDNFKEYEDPLFGRKVYWYWEPNGNWGKSIVCKYFIDNEDAIMVQGKNNDILFGISEYVKEHGNSPKIVIIDVPRCNNGHVSYSAIESIKNGCFFNGKYESGMCRFDSPHVIVFANEPPDCKMLSDDRWSINYLE